MSSRTKATGFMKYERQAPAKRPALERVRDWQPLQLRLPDETLAGTGGPLHGLRHPLLPPGAHPQPDDHRLPAEQPDPGME